jgi:PhnB protein
MAALRISLMLAVENAAEAAAWYERALGATQLWSLGSVVGLEVEGAPFFLHEPTDDFVEVFVADPDAFVRRAVAEGADGSEEAIRDHEVPWGVHRQGGFRDPFGHAWLVGDESPLQRFPRRPSS